MKQTQDYAHATFTCLADAPLFRTLARGVPPGRSLQILPYCTFWSNVFQDLIALNLERVRDPALRKIVQTHYDEDAGHHIWFARDLRTIFGDLPDVLAVFSPALRAAREVAYALIAEVYRAESDEERLVLPIALEEAAKNFLPVLIGHFQAAGLGPHLFALGDAHVAAEASHTLHDDETDALLHAIVLTGPVRARAYAMLERTLAAFQRFAAILDHAIEVGSSANELMLAARVQELLSSGSNGEVVVGR